VTPETGLSGEFLCRAKDPRHPERNEDRAVLALPWGAAVIDGATDITGERYQSRTGGWLAADALARLLTRAAADGDLARWDDQTLVRAANEAIIALYRDLHIESATEKDAGRRFRAAMAVARAMPEGLRITSIALTGIRIDGRRCPLMRSEPEYQFEKLLARMRSVLWDDPDLAHLSVAEREEACRELVIFGRSATTMFSGAWRRAEQTVRTQVPGPADLIDAAFAGGLIGNRRARSPKDTLFGAAVDGYCGEYPPVWAETLPWGTFQTIELFTDGYTEPPGAVTIAAWEDHVRHVNTVDPHRIGPYAAVKGAVPGGHHDDRTVVILREWAREGDGV
jgi:hypothetical protein